MKKSVVTMLCGILIIGLAHAADTQVTSKNAVGYVNRTVKSGCRYLLAPTFFDMTSDAISVTNMLDPSVCSLPSGTVLSLWNVAAQTYLGSESIVSFGGTLRWAPGTNVLNLGESFWLMIPEKDPQEEYDLYLMGEVPDVETIVQLANGISFAAYSFPVDTHITNSGLSGVVSSGSIVSFWDPEGGLYGRGGYVSESYVTFGGSPRWEPGTNVFHVADGVIIKSPTDTNWIQRVPYNLDN